MSSVALLTAALLTALDAVVPAAAALGRELVLQFDRRLLPRGGVRSEGDGRRGRIEDEEPVHAVAGRVGDA